MKKLLSALLVLALVCGLFAGCAKTPSATEPGNGPSEKPSQGADDPSGQATEPSADPTDYTAELGKNNLLLQIPRYTADLTQFNWSVEDMGDGASLLAIKKVKSKDGYDQYLKDLAAAGFSLYAENTIEENHFGTFVKDSIYVTTMYTPGSGNVRILAEPSSVTALPGMEKDNVYTDKGIENVVAMVGVDYDGETNNGMCFVYRLCDGSFIVVDGGFNQPSCAKAIYDTMVKLAPDPENITIAAWFISHAHGDHIGGYYAFASKYGSQVKLEKVIYNFPIAKVFEVCDTSLSHLDKVKSCTAMFGGDKVVYNAHPGQVYYIRDAVIQMLYTWDIYRYNNTGINFFNDSSLVFTLDLGGTRVMQFGDCGPQATAVLEEIYTAATLKSDFIQSAHHGYLGASVNLYNMVGGKVVMWTSTDYKVDIFRTEDVNRVLWNSPYVYIADQRVTVIPLHFDETKVEKWVIEDYIPRVDPNSEPIK